MPSRNKFAVLLMITTLLAAACAPVQVSRETPVNPEEIPAAPTRQEETRQSDMAARTRAAQNLILMAIDHLSAYQPDAAIQYLERALQMDPNNGECYYYLSRAWLQKGNRNQALEFYRLAAIHLPDDGRWDERMALQKAAIDN